MSDLDDMENQMANSAAATAAPPEKGEAVVEDSKDSMSMALSALPDPVVRRISTIAARYGIRHNQDPMWALVEAVQDGMECARAAAAAAAAAAASADNLHAGVGKIQGQIFQGAVKAGQEVKKEVVSGVEVKLTEGGRAIVAAIGIAADAGATKIRAGSIDLIGKLDAAIEAKKSEGVDAFAKSAAHAAAAAAKAAGARRFMWSVWGVAGLLIVFAAVGAIVDHEYLSLTHQIAPRPLVVSADGKPVCGVIRDNETVCQIQ